MKTKEKDFMTDYRVLAKSLHEENLVFYGYKTSMTIVKLQNFSKKTFIPFTIGSIFGFSIISLTFVIINKPSLMPFMRYPLILCLALIPIALVIELLSAYRKRRVKKEDYNLTLSLRRIIALDTGNWRAAETARFHMVDDIENNQRLATQGFGCVVNGDNPIEFYDFYSDEKGLWHSEKR